MTEQASLFSLRYIQNIGGCCGKKREKKEKLNLATALKHVP